MRYLTPRVALVVVSLCFTAALRGAGSLLPAERVSFENLAAFRPAPASWKVAGGLQSLLRNDHEVSLAPGTGVIVNTPVAGAAANEPLVTTWEHGDLDLEVEFLLSPEADSGVVLQGRYEVQLRDSRGVKVATFADHGGIAQRWDPARGAGREGFEGHAPAAIAGRAPGLWQRLAVQFRAPRFDDQGRKTAPARFVEVELNGYVVHRDVEVGGPTQGAAFSDEQARGPLVLLGGRNPVAFRNLKVKRYGDAQVALHDLKLSYFAGAGLNLDNYSTGKPLREGPVPHFTGAVLSSDERGVARYTATLEVPVAGEYELRADLPAPARLSVDGAVVVYPGLNSPQSGTVMLTAGRHALLVEQYNMGGWALRTGGLRVWIEGPGIVSQQLVPAPARPRPAGDSRVSIPVEPTGRILLQRTFVPLEHSRRLYACFVGSPAGVHYAYDLEQATLIGMWRGGFFEGRDLWHQRAEDQHALPTGAGLTIEGKPLLFQFGQHDARWPTLPPPTSATRGYRLEPDGQPVFLFEFSGVSVEDRIAPLADGTGLARTLKFSGKPREKDAWALLAEGSRITAQPDGRGFIVGDREFYLDWPENSPVQPTLRREGDRTQLLVRVNAAGPKELTYNLVW